MNQATSLPLRGSVGTTLAGAGRRIDAADDARLTPGPEHPRYGGTDGAQAIPLDGHTASVAVGLRADGAGPEATGWDGLTRTALSFTAALDPGRSVHQIEFAIADTGDTLFDSAMFLSGLQGADARRRQCVGGLVGPPQDHQEDPCFP